VATPEEPFAERDGHIDHPYLVTGAIQARDYQRRIATECLDANTLVILPTGLGKTVIAALVIAETLRRGARHVLFLAPTRPLAQQHHESLRAFLRDEGLIDLFSGGVPPAKRAERWSKAVVVVATPQTVRNDLAQARYDLLRTGLILYDEAHHATGDYAYVDIAQQLRFQNPKARVVGLTASPGASRERQEEIRRNLGIDRVRHLDERHPDVAKYVPHTEIEWRTVRLPASIRRVQRLIQGVFDERIQTLRKVGLLPERDYGAGKKELVEITQRLGRRAGAGGGNAQTWAGLHAAQGALFATTALEYVETQGLVPLKRFLERKHAKPDPSRAERSFLNDPRIQEVWELLSKGVETSHPKVEALGVLLRDLRDAHPKAIALVFAQYRDTVDVLVDDLNARGIKAQRFVGQGKRGETQGLSQAEQREVLGRFRDREFMALVSTSVGEEGIDVPQVDLVVFYEPVPSEIRSIQRRGRTGRTVAGRVVVLVTQDSRDEAYLQISRGRERTMRRNVARRGA
jgi:Fanconi anemia group M protein